MVQETRVQSQVESYQRFKKWYLMPPCLTLSIIKYRSRVKWSSPGIGELRPSLHLGVVANEKGAFKSPLTTVANFTYFYLPSGISTPFGLCNTENVYNHNDIFNVPYHFSKIIFLSIIIRLPSVLWFQVFLSNTNNSRTLILFQVDIFI